MQLALDALDRLVETLEETGPLSTVEAARSLFATSSISEGLAASLLVDVTAGDSRVVCSGASVSLTGETRDPLLEEAAFVVFDLETTGLSAQRDRICEFGAVRVQGLELVDSFQSLVNPGVALPGPVERLTGLRTAELRHAPPVRMVLPRFLAFAGDDLLVAHNAGFDQRFLERELQVREGRRLSQPPLCTAALARRLLEGRLRKVGLASLAHFFGVGTTPCHRALPDAEATAEVLLCLIGLAQELGARRSSAVRSPVRRSTGPGNATPGLTRDWNESTSSSPCTRTAPISQIRSRCAESPVVSRSKTTNAASSSSGSRVSPVRETEAPLQTTRLSPAVTSTSSEAASPSEMELVANSDRAASTVESGPVSSSVSTRRSRASSASCTHHI